MTSRLAVFGASGFVGRSLVCKLRAKGYQVLAVHRNLRKENYLHSYEVNLQSPEKITQFLRKEKITHVINAIGKAHDTNITNESDYDLYKHVNVILADKIASGAIKSSEVQKLILLSTSKVYGQLAFENNPSENCLGVDLTTYGRTKFEGERVVLQRLEGTTVQPVILRMPLVYGRGVKGNLRSLYQIILRGLPIPLNGITENRRSMLSVSNLCSFIELIVNSGKFSNKVYNLKDANDYSTAEIIKNIIIANDLKDRTFRLNPKLLDFIITRYSKPLANKLLFSDTLDDGLARTELGWSPQAFIQDDMHF
jgi:nucleoside-diphosphate-sugar epimerase